MLVLNVGVLKHRLVKTTITVTCHLILYLNLLQVKSVIRPPGLEIWGALGVNLSLTA